MKIMIGLRLCKIENIFNLLFLKEHPKIIHKIILSLIIILNKG